MFSNQSIKCQGSRSVAMIGYIPDLVYGKGDPIKIENHESGAKNLRMRLKYFSGSHHYHCLKKYLNIDTRTRLEWEIKKYILFHVYS